MRTKRTLLAVAAALAGCAVITWFSTSIHGRETIYEVRPQITIPEYKTDTARTIDAYERLMERCMMRNEKELTVIGTDLKHVVRKLNSIDAKLTGLTRRITRIEKALGIEPPKTTTKKTRRKRPSPPPVKN
ncbi:MAG: hypothetical protein ACYS1A_07945 [Planctomycetota bacterium]|jgi:hypothetical protein